MAPPKSKKQAFVDENSGAASDANNDGERDFAADILGDDSPEGFRRVNPLDGDRHYFKAVEGGTVRGVLLGRFKRTDTEEGEDKFYYQIRATSPCEHVTTGDGATAKCEIGQIVQLDERAGLRDLAGIANASKPQEVFIRSVEKIKLKKSAGTFWRWDVFARDASRSTLAKLAEAVTDPTVGF